MFTGLRSRLWLSYAVVIAIALGIVAVILLLYLYRNPLLYRQKLERLRAISSVVAARQADGPALFNAAMLQRAANNFDVRLILYSEEQVVIVDTHSGIAPALAFPNRSSFLRSLPIAKDNQGKNWLFTVDQLTNGNWLMVAVSRPRLTLVDVFADDLFPLFFRAGVLALILSLVAGFVIARWIADPLQKVVATARAVPEVTTDIGEIRGPREIQDLAGAFDSMLSRLRASQKSQREFVANVSHELKTPLTSIQGFAQAILDDTAGTTEARRQAAGIIYDEAGRMHRLVLDLLDLARFEAGTAEISLLPVDVKQLLIAISEKLAPQASAAGVTLNVEIKEILPEVIGDLDRLSQVFSNLVDNAIKFTPRGGRILIRASTVDRALEIIVSDNGPGISHEEQYRVFDRFYQVDRSRRGGRLHGVGLGLAIAREIVLAHGGTISLRSQLGQGTSFIVRLPPAASRIAMHTGR